jgi:hypothetical protein
MNNFTYLDCETSKKNDIASANNQNIVNNNIEENIQLETIMDNQANENIINVHPVYSTDEVLQCAVISYGDKKYLLDNKDRDIILNSNKKFTILSVNDLYPAFTQNYKRINYVEYLHKIKDITHIKFKNNNKYDLRKDNIEAYHHFHNNIMSNYNVIEYIHGHINDIGIDSGVEKNPLWKILDEDNKEYFIMYCEKNTLCKLCPESYQKILDYEKNNNNGKKITFHKHANGYILSNILLYIHQIILECHGNGKGTKNKSVDHIDRDPLNNTLENLRIATRKEQEANTKGIIDGTKRERKHNAVDLPDGISQDMMRKYVYYCHEYLDKDKTRSREFFRVDKNPKLDKIWSSSKSNKISLLEKLAQANKVADDLENDIYPDDNKDETEIDAPKIPKYISFHMARGKPHLVFEKYLNGKRLNLKMVLQEEYDLKKEILRIASKVKDKYDYDIVIE